MAILSRRFSTGASTLLRIFTSKPKAEAAAAAPSLEQEADLYTRLSALKCGDGEVVDAISEYVKEGGTVNKIDLERCIKIFRKFNRYNHVLEIGEWMKSQKTFTLKNKDHAIHLDVIAKVDGITAAENYFNALPPSSKVSSIYGTLLNCYCRVKMSNEALDLFIKMQEANMIVAPLPFNHLMSMHIKMEQPEKAVHLEEEMKKANIQPNTYTCNLLMTAYSLLNDIEGVERVFSEMMAAEKDGKNACDWTTYSNLANIYIRLGDQEKAKQALRNLEEVMGKRQRDAYHYMMSLYARMSDLPNTYRVWKTLNSAFKNLWNTSYLIMIQALDNLDDIEGVKELFEEWESVCSSYDSKLANSVVAAYLRRDMLEEAERVLERALVRSKGRFFYAWEMMMIFHVKKGNIKQALEVMETAVSKAGDGKWKPREDTLDGFYSYFEQEGDVSSAEELYELMKRIDCVDGRLYESLVRTYIGVGRKLDDVAVRMERDGVEMSVELENLVEKVSLARRSF